MSEAEFIEPTEPRVRATPVPTPVETLRRQRRLRLALSDRFGAIAERFPAGATELRDRLRLLCVGAVGALCGFFFLRIRYDAARAGFKPIFPDSGSILGVALKGPFALKGLWFGERPIVVPLVVWALGSETERIATFQTLVSLGAFTFCALTIWQLCRSKWVGAVGVIGVFLLGTLGRYQLWSPVLLTESLTISLSLLMFCSWLRLLVLERRRRQAWWTFAWTILWTGTRDSNTLVMLATLGLAAAVFVALWLQPNARRNRRVEQAGAEQAGAEQAGAEQAGAEQAGVDETIGLDRSSSRTESRSRPTPLIGMHSAFSTRMVLGLLAFGIYMMVAQSVSNRSVTAIHDNIGRRVLPEASMRDWFVDEGMPLDLALEGRTGKDSWADGNESFLLNPQLGRYRTWANGPGKFVLARSYVERFPWWFHRFGIEWRANTPRTLRDYDLYGVDARLYSFPLAHIVTAHPLSAVGAVLGLLAPALAFFGRRRHRRIGVVLCVAGVSALLDVFLGFAGDALEVWRHMIPGQFRIELTMLFVVVCSADAIVGEVVAWTRLGVARPSPEETVVPQAVLVPEVPEAAQPVRPALAWPELPVGPGPSSMDWVTVEPHGAVAQERAGYETRQSSSPYAARALGRSTTDWPFEWPTQGPVDPREVEKADVALVEQPVVQSSEPLTRSASPHGRRTERAELAKRDERDEDEALDAAVGRSFTGNRRASAIVAWFTGLVAFLLGAGSLFNNESNSQDWDPQYARDIVERAARFGGSYYTNGIHNKGPIETLAYDVAKRLTTFHSFWFAISAMALLSAGLIGSMVYAGSLTVGRSRWFAVAGGVATYIHFSLSGADYAGKLYSRNIAIAMFSVAVMIMIHASSSGRFGSKSIVVIGVCLGLVVQTLVTAAISAAVLTLAAFAFIWVARTTAKAARGQMLLLTIAGAVSFLTAPVWYLLQGEIGIFWKSWWVYGQYMTEATGRSFDGIIRLGLEQQYAYYLPRPLIAGLFGCFIVLSISLWRVMSPNQRILHVMTIVWFFTATLEIILTQRNSSHYYSVSAVPIALGLGLLAAWCWTAITALGATGRAGWVWALIAIFVALQLDGRVALRNGLYGAGGLPGPQQFARQREGARSGDTIATQATLDLVTKPADPVFVWTNVPWPYLSYHRVSATRFIWKQFLMGEIYLGRTSPDYILPGSWDWFRADLAESQPKIMFMEPNTTVDPGTPAAEYAASRFTPVISTPAGTVSYERSILQRMQAPPPVSTPLTSIVAAGSGWISTGGTTRYTRSGISPDQDLLPITEGNCQRIDGLLLSQGAQSGSFVVRMTDTRPASDGYVPNERLSIALEGAEAVGASDFVAFTRFPSGQIPGKPTRFTIFIGRRSSALMIDGKILASVATTSDVAVKLEPRADTVQVDSLTVAPFEDCPK